MVNNMSKQGPKKLLICTICHLFPYQGQQRDVLLDLFSHSPPPLFLGCLGRFLFFGVRTERYTKNPPKHSTKGSTTHIISTRAQKILIMGRKDI